MKNVKEKSDALVNNDMRQVEGGEPIKITDAISSLLLQLEPIDYYRIANINHGRAISKDAFGIITVEKLLEIADSENRGFAMVAAEPHIFNGIYWMKIDSARLDKLLMEASLKMGVPNLTAKHHKFISDAKKQFYLFSNIADYDSKDVVINFQNGALHVSRDGYVLKDFDKEDYLLYQLPYLYDKNAKCPQFLEFLNEVLPDKDAQKVLAEYLAYALAPDLKYEKMLILLGQGSNGKSVIYEIVRALFGDENVSSYSLEGLTEPKSYSRPALPEKILNYGSEMSGKIHEEALKKLISGEKLEAREIYGKIFDIQRFARLMNNANSLPKALLESYAVRRRLLIIPFEKIISEDKQDRHLAEKIIKTELSGILNWVLEGLSRLLEQEGFTESELIDRTLKHHSKLIDTVALFLEDEGYISDSESKIYKAKFQKSYKEYCINNGFTPLNRNEVRDKLLSLKIGEGDDSKGNFYYLKKK